MKIPRMISIGRILIKENSTLLRSLGETAFKTACFAVKLVAIFFIASNIKNFEKQYKA
jgi:hypothetical protein